MTRYHATPEGNIPFTPKEEVEFTAEALAYSVGEDDRKAEDIRDERNNLIKQSDWMGCSDVVMSDAWKTYRQELRDIPAQPEFPDNITWPTSPEVTDNVSD